MRALPRPSRAPQTSLADAARPAFGALRVDTKSSGELIACQPTPANLKLSPACSSAAANVHVCASASLDKLLGTRLASSSLTDRDVFLADENGNVLFERGSSGFRIAALDKTAPDKASGAKTDAGSSGAGIVRLPPIADCQQVTAISHLALDGTAATLLTQPVRIATGGEQGDQVWVLGVLLPAAALDAQALEHVETPRRIFHSALWNGVRSWGFGVWAETDRPSRGVMGVAPSAPTP
ncbi:MAG: hypothetical protein ABI629_01070 [bacterium]